MENSTYKNMPINIYSATLEILEKICTYSNLEINPETFIKNWYNTQFMEGDNLESTIKSMMKYAIDRISLENKQYNNLAGGLVVSLFYLQAYNSLEAPSLYEHIQNLTHKGFYEKDILEHYTQEEIEQIGMTCINNDKDYNLTYCAAKQYQGKYLVKDRVNNIILETPQIALATLCLSLFVKVEDKEERFELIRKLYYYLSNGLVSLPTPIMAGVRTPLKQYSSCVLLECGDSIESISSTTSAILKYVSQRAGIGINVGQIRAVNAPVKCGSVAHTGITPFIKLFQAATKSCAAGGIRSGATSVFFPIWHLEIENLLVMRNNRGVEDNRARHIDYCCQISRLFYKRLQKQENITLFSPHEVKDLYDAFFADNELFEKLYEKYEQDPNIKMKKVVKATEVFSLLMLERSSTGRIYIQNVDHSNTHSAFISDKAPIKQSNLCCEVTLPTKPLDEKHNGEVALCILAALNIGKLSQRSEMEFKHACSILVYALDYLIDKQTYPIPEAEYSATKRRSLGIGIINYAYYLANNGYKYSDDSGNKATHELFEKIQYYCLQASVELAKQKGACELYNDTKYSIGLLPIDTCKKLPDELNFDLLMDWESLRKDIKKYGLRNSTLTSLMPSETSSQISNATNGIEPPRALISVKQSKDGILKQVVPELSNPNYSYELLWDLPNNSGYLRKCAIMQKFIDQAISINTNYDPDKFPDGKVPMNVMLKDLLLAYSLGTKTLYYHNTRDHSGKSDILKEGCESGACAI